MLDVMNPVEVYGELAVIGVEHVAEPRPPEYFVMLVR